jgi:hypothetical protein
MRSPRKTLRRLGAHPQWRTTRLFLYVPRGLRSVVAFGRLALDELESLLDMMA